jgi:hypothetical protein
MRSLFLSAGIGLAAGLICFFISVAFLAIVLLIMWGVSHSHPDLTLAYKAAAPVALLAAITGFVVSLTRSIRAAARR